MHGFGVASFRELVGHPLTTSGNLSRTTDPVDHLRTVRLVSCPINNLLDPPADFRAGQGAPTRHSGHYGEEAQRRPARKDAGAASELFMGQDTRGTAVRWLSQTASPRMHRA